MFHPVNLEDDIVERIQRDFPPDQVDDAVRLLDPCFRGRVARCIVLAGQGSLESLVHYIDVAKRDFRDVIMAGEYAASFGERIRDLSVSFLIDSREKMWISYLARRLYGHGFRLKDLEIRVLPLDPCDPARGRYEGTAKFAGRLGELKVEKQNRHWMLHTDLNYFELKGLDCPHENGVAFADHLATMLAAIQKPNPNRRKS